MKDDMVIYLSKLYSENGQFSVLMTQKDENTYIIEDNPFEVDCPYTIRLKIKSDVPITSVNYDFSTNLLCDSTLNHIRNRGIKRFIPIVFTPNKGVFSSGYIDLDNFEVKSLDIGLGSFSIEEFFIER